MDREDYYYSWRKVNQGDSCVPDSKKDPLPPLPPNKKNFPTKSPGSRATLEVGKLRKAANKGQRERMNIEGKKKS